MSYWKEQVVDLGTVQAGFKYSLQFQAEDNIPEIVDVVASCGCTKPKYDKATKILSVTFKPKPLSMELQQQGKTFYMSNKTIRVYYANNTVTEMLSIKAKVIK